MKARLFNTVLFICFAGIMSCKSPGPWGRPRTDTIPPALLAQFRWLHANDVLVTPGLPFCLPDATKTWWEYTVDAEGNETITRKN